jgi:hypothetical protein
VGSDHIILFLGVFGRASNVIVNQYSLEMLDDSVLDIFTDELILSFLSHHFSVRPYLTERECAGTAHRKQARRRWWLSGGSQAAGSATVVREL